jgi:2-oxoisovalerate dehydrogenase E1 component alpha subunit
VIVPRLTAHSSDDRQEKYRSTEELAHLPEHDPVRVFTAELRERGVLTPAREQELRARIQREVDEGTELAEAAPLPDPAASLRGVYFDPDAGR